MTFNKSYKKPTQEQIDEIKDLRKQIGEEIDPLPDRQFTATLELNRLHKMGKRKGKKKK